MKKMIFVLGLMISVLLVSGCVTETVYYTPAYTSRYVYSAGYAKPYWWSDPYYYGYDDLGDVGYWGMYDSYNVY